MGNTFAPNGFRAVRAPDSPGRSNPNHNPYSSLARCRRALSARLRQTPLQTRKVKPCPYNRSCWSQRSNRKSASKPGAPVSLDTDSHCKQTRCVLHQGDLQEEAKNVANSTRCDATSLFPLVFFSTSVAHCE